MKVRKMTLDEICDARFCRIDVLFTAEERHERDIKLRSAMALTNGQHEPVWLKLKLADGQVAEVYSDLIDLEDDYVELHGGFGIPLNAIYDVGV